MIGGQFKGRRLKAPSWDGLRPTSDKLRETLFNILSARIEGARVVDGFAGTGAVGLEALSRGAAHVLFIERDRRAAALIASNLVVCGVKEGYTIECADVVSVLLRVPRGSEYDLVLLDPPYDIDPETVTRTLEAAAGAIAAKGLVVLEHASRRAPNVPPVLGVVRNIASGDSTLTLLRRV